MAATSFAMPKAVGHHRQLAQQPARGPAVKPVAQRTSVRVSAHHRSDEAGPITKIGQSVLTAALVASFGMGMTPAALANPDDGLSPSEKRAAAAERRKEILRATREKAEQNAASLEEKGEATEAPVESDPEPESTASEMATDLKAMLKEYQSAPSPAAAPAPAPETKAPEPKPEKPKPAFSFSMPKAETLAPEPAAPPPAPEKKAPEPEPEKPKPSFSFSVPKPAPAPAPAPAPEPKTAPAASKEDLLNMLDSKSVSKPSAKKEEPKKQEAKKQDAKKDSKKNKRKGPLPPFLAEAVMGGLIYSTFLAGTKYSKETKQATEALGSFVKKNLS